jgi:putative N6-adenine-specific DNA methylase
MQYNATNKINKYLAKTLYGLEQLAIEELTQFGAQEIEITTRGAFFKATLETVYKINLASRFIIRVLKPVLSFKANNEDELYQKSLQINWSNFFEVSKTIKVEHNIISERFKNTQFAALKVKDAIADKFRADKGKRPSVDLKEPDILVNLYIQDNQASILLDATGKSLHFRGYKRNFNVAPLNEVLAAAMVKLSGWTPEIPLYDAMCGSGTLPIEAALMACNISPNINRKSFCFKHWLNFDEPLFISVVQELKGLEVQPENLTIFASDLSNNAINITIDNAENAGVAQYIKAKRKGFNQLKPQTEEGMIILNPPYGERMGDQDEIEQFYKQMGDTLKFNFSGFSAWVISSNIEALKALGLKPSKRIKLFNGQLECSYNAYNLYKGSRYDN